MSFSDHARIDIPAPKRSGLDVLRTEGLGQIHGAFYMLRIRFRLDPAALLFVEGPITVELKATVAYSWSRQHAARDGIRIRNQGRHRRALVANGSDTEVDKSG